MFVTRIVTPGEGMSVLCVHNYDTDPLADLIVIDGWLQLHSETG